MRKQVVDSYSFAGMESADAEREAARALAACDELTARMYRPLSSISRAAGEIERESALFFGSGENPTLF